MSQHNQTSAAGVSSQSTFTSQAERRWEVFQAYAIATLFLGVIAAWGWACIVGINS